MIAIGFLWTNGQGFGKQVAERNHDVQLTDYIEVEFLAEQVKYNFGVYTLRNLLFSDVWK